MDLKKIGTRSLSPRPILIFDKFRGVTRHRPKLTTSIGLKEFPLPSRKKRLSKLMKEIADNNQKSIFGFMKDFSVKGSAGEKKAHLHSANAKSPEQVTEFLDTQN